MKLDKQNMPKTSLKLAASESCGDICAAECLVNGRRMLVVIVYVSPNTPSDDLIFSNLAGYSPNVCKMFTFLTRRGCEDKPIILAGDFNDKVKDNYNAELVQFLKDTSELDVLSDLSQGTTRSNSCIDMVFGRNVDILSCMNHVSYFSYHRPILSRTNQQAPKLTDTDKLNALGNFNK
jgi:endonuclease/exonuclease/phosphatase (EEP) superfamily protein YafD